MDDHRKLWEHTAHRLVQIIRATVTHKVLESRGKEGEYTACHLSGITTTNHLVKFKSIQI